MSTSAPSGPPGAGPDGRADGRPAGRSVGGPGGRPGAPAAVVAEAAPEAPAAVAAGGAVPGTTAPRPLGRDTAVLVGAVLARPDLWWTALGELRRMAPRLWWRNPPRLPWPDRRLWEFRMVTAYGRPDAVPTRADVVSFLEWCRATSATSSSSSSSSASSSTSSSTGPRPGGHG